MRSMLNIITAKVWEKFAGMFKDSPKIWTKQEIRSEVYYLVGHVFGVNCEDNMKFSQLGVDSIDMLDLMSEVEATFEVQIVTKETAKLATINQLIEYVAKQLSTKSE